MELKNRPRYLEKLIAFKDTDMIKVLVGMRRCGKSSLMRLLANHLRDQDVASDHLVEMNFESAEFLEIDEWPRLLEFAEERIASASDDDRIYFFLDEVQLVKGWERAVNAIRLNERADIYITGSNAYLLSSQLTTLLSGRYVQIEIYPLTFSEYLDFSDDIESVDRAFARYLAYGGLPPVVEQGHNDMLAQTVLSGIYNTIFVKDVAQHIQVRNAAVLNDVAAFLADTSGSSVSVVNIERRLANAHRKTSNETIERYIQALVDAFLFYRVRRHDIRGGKRLQGLEKYYPADLGIKSMLLGFPKGNYGFALENAVMNELKARGYDVSVGRTGSAEIDFIATRAGETAYIQVCASMMDEQTRKREFAALSGIPREAGTKTILTLDRMGLGSVDGIDVTNAIDWMLAFS